MLTDKDIQDAIEECEWRKNLAGTWICTGDIVPCLKHIDDGRCVTLIKLFGEVVNDCHDLVKDLVKDTPTERVEDEPQTERSACDTCQWYNGGIPCGVEPSVCKREVKDKQTEQEANQ